MSGTELVKSVFPTYAELIENFDNNAKLDEFTRILNQPPPAQWIKTNKYAGNSLYLPIDKVEYLLKTLFKKHKIEILGCITTFNAVTVTVRVHYFHPIELEWYFYDGIGASEVQTKAGASASDLAAISTNALAMAAPKAETEAIKDACHKFGNVFGANLNRNEIIVYDTEKPVNHETLTELFELKGEQLTSELFKNAEKIINNKEIASYNKLFKYLQSL